MLLRMNNIRAYRDTLITSTRRAQHTGGIMKAPRVRHRTPMYRAAAAPRRAPAAYRRRFFAFHTFNSREAIERRFRHARVTTAA